MSKSPKKPHSEKKPAAKNLDSRRTEADQSAADANLSQSEKEEEKPWHKRTPVIVALIPAIGALLVVLFQLILPVILNSCSTSHTFAGKVVDKQTRRGISEAKVSLEAKGASPVIYTDSEGFFSFHLAPDTHEIKIRVAAEGYNPFDRRIDVSAKNELEDIRLEPISTLPQAISPVSLDTNAQNNTMQIQNNNLANERSSKPRGRSNRTSDLEKRERQALKDLHSNSSSPEP